MSKYAECGPPCCGAGEYSGRFEVTLPTTKRWLILAVVASGVSSGCATVGGDLAEDGLVRVETTDFGETLRCVSIQVLQENDSVMIHGSTKTKRLGRELVDEEEAVKQLHLAFRNRNFHMPRNPRIP